MHEVDMTKCLFFSMEEWKTQYHPLVPSVDLVHLQVGEFTCVEPEALVFTWSALVDDTWLAGSQLMIESIPLLARCLGCGTSYSPRAEQAYQSPCCKHPMEQIISGRELKIRSIDYFLPSGPSKSPAVDSNSSLVTIT